MPDRICPNHGRLAVSLQYCNKPTQNGQPCGQRAHLDTGTLLYNGKYSIVRKLAEGGMATVYHGVNNSSGEYVAIKEIRVVPDPTDPQKLPSLIAKFEGEGRILRSISSLHVVKCFDNWDDFGTKFMALEFVDGEDFEQKAHAQGGTMTNEMEIIQFAIATCEGLKVLHATSVVHRDIKPANIMQDKSGRIIVMDLGISKTYVATAGTGTMIGTPGYDAQEQALGHAEPRSDLYSVGMSMVRLKLGPHVVNQLWEERLDFVDQLPIPWQGIIRRAIAVDATDRQVDVAELIADLQSLLPVQAPITQPLRPRIRPVIAPPIPPPVAPVVPTGPISLTFDATVSAAHGSSSWRQPVTGTVKQGGNALSNVQIVLYLLDRGSGIVYTGAKERPITTDAFGKFALPTRMLTAQNSVTERQITAIVMDPADPRKAADQQIFTMVRPAGAQMPGAFQRLNPFAPSTPITAPLPTTPNPWAAPVTTSGTSPATQTAPPKPPNVFGMALGLALLAMFVVMTGIGIKFDWIQIWSISILGSIIGLRIFRFAQSGELKGFDGWMLALKPWISGLWFGTWLLFLLG